MSKTNFERVKQFNTVFGHPAPTNLNTTIFTDTPKIVSLRNSLINEEIEELKEAFENNDVIEIIDALSDIQYVAYGLLVVYGFDGDAEFSKFIENKYTLLNFTLDKSTNLTNFQQTTQLINNFTKLNTSAKTFLEQLNILTFKETFTKYLNDLYVSYKDLEDSTLKQNYESTLNNTLEIIFITYVLGIFVGVDLDESIRLVHESNMSKICSSEEEAIKTVEWYKENEKRYDTPSFKCSNGDYIVYNESTGKILKNINYRAVDLSVFLN